jgi:hypothetical protein
MRKQAIAVAAAALVTGSLLYTSSKAENDFEIPNAPTGRLTVEPKGAVLVTDGEPPVLRTQQFENGQLQMKDVESSRLETFLRDLNKRRDYDFSQHQNRAGPDHEYLTTWIHKTMDELFARGYSIDKYGDLHRPGEVVSTR